MVAEGQSAEMTINPSQYTNWQQKPQSDLAVFNHLSPNLALIRDYCVTTFHVADVGGYGVRPIRTGTSLSSHSFGAANDLSYRGFAVGSDAAAVAERRLGIAPCIAWLVENSAELGVSAVHDYLNGRIWHPNRDLNLYPDGWKPQAPDLGGMGQTWGDWLHVEVDESRWYDSTPVASRLKPGVPPPAAWPSIHLGSSGPLVAAFQTILHERASQDVGPIDGSWGLRTQKAWDNVVAFVPELSRDKSCEGDDWKVVAWIDRGWTRLYAAGFPR